MSSHFRFTRDYVLENDYVLLRPIHALDANNLLEYACNEPDLWRYALISAAGADNMVRYIGRALKERHLKRQYTFIVFDKVTQAYVGSTRFCEIHRDTQCTQLGYTWYGKRFRGTLVNKHCKLLLLDFAFCVMQMERVEFRADVDNEAGIEALKGLGCTLEGRLRSCGPNPGAARRDCYVFSILKEEWTQGLRNRLVQKLFHRLHTTEPMQAAVPAGFPAVKG